MNDLAFRALMDLIMCDDPSQTQREFRDALTDFAEEEAKKRGYPGWIDAYHLFKPNAAYAYILPGS